MRPAALEYLSLSWQQNSAVGRELSVKPDKTAQAVERLLGEVQSLKARCAGLEEAEFHRLAEEHRGAGNVLLVQPPMEPDSVRRLCDAVSRTCSGRCAVFRRDRRRVQIRRHPPGAGHHALYESHECRPPWPGRGGQDRALPRAAPPARRRKFAVFGQKIHKIRKTTEIDPIFGLFRSFLFIERMLYYFDVNQNKR